MGKKNLKDDLARLAEYVRTKGLDYFLNPSKQVIKTFTGTIYDSYGDVNLNLLYSLSGRPI